MYIVLLAAGKGQRFKDAGYEKIKPLIDVNGKPMFEAVLDELLEQLPGKHNVTVVARSGSDIPSDKYKLLLLGPEQKGAAWSALEFVEHIPPDEELLILNCDQMCKFDGQAFTLLTSHKKTDGVLFHFIEPFEETKWGRSIIDDHEMKVVSIVEKTPVSPFAHTGHYYFRYASDFVFHARQMIEQDIKVNGEYFLSPVYNLMIEAGKNIYPFFVEEFYGIGVPEDLEAYLKENPR